MKEFYTVSKLNSMTTIDWENELIRINIIIEMVSDLKLEIYTQKETGNLFTLNELKLTAKKLDALITLGWDVNLIRGI